MKLVIHTVTSNGAAHPPRGSLRGAAQRYLLLAMGLAILIGVATLFSILFLTIAGIVLLLVGLAWAASIIRGVYWRCPNCQRSNYLAARRGYHCQHCDVPEFAPNDRAEQQWETIDVRSTAVRQ